MTDDRAARRQRAPEGGFFDRIETGDGISLRAAVWGAKAARRGTVLLLQGRREFIEKYYETAADLLDRGYAVAALDWRGQGLSDRLLPDRQKGHVEHFTDYLEDMACFLDWARLHAPAPFIIMAHSMGGHIAARYLAAAQDAATKETVARAVLIAPMIGIRFGMLPEPMARGIARMALSWGLQDRYALKQEPYSEAGRRSEALLLSSDPERLKDEILFCRDNPALALGGVTYGWVAAALQSMDVLSAPGAAEAIALPVLVTLAGADQVVDNRRTLRFTARMPQASVTVIDASRHEILKERDLYRAAFWAAFDSFQDLS